MLAEGAIIGWSDLSSVWSVITAQISVASILGILAGVAVAAVALVFMWFGLRKAIKVLMAAAKKGKLSV